MTFPFVFLKCGIAYCELGKRKKNGNSHNEVYMVFVALLPPATKLGQGYVFTRVCDSVQGGVFASVHAGIYTPGADTPSMEQTPGADSPRDQCIMGDTGNKRAVRILLECHTCLAIYNYSFSD